MKTLTSRFSILLAVIVLFMACSKEMSLENGLSAGLAGGELVDSLGNCKRADVRGSYQVDTPLNGSTNYAVINVNFTSQGKYKIYSDTVNGMWFIDSGFTVTTGAVPIKIKGYGTPILPKVTDFSLFFNNTLCTFSVAVGGSIGTATGTKGDYFPTTSGSTFEYKFTPKIGLVETLGVTVANGTVRFDNKDFSKFLTDRTDTFYFAKDGAGTYYALSTLDFDYTYLFTTVPANFIVYPFLKENANVGESWTTQDYGPVEIPNPTRTGMANAVFTIMEKGITYQVPTPGGKIYNNVINVRRVIMFKQDGTTTFVPYVEGNSYYAKDYGLIDQVFKTFPQTVSVTGVPVIK